MLKAVGNKLTSSINLDPTPFLKISETLFQCLFSKQSLLFSFGKLAQKKQKP